MAERWTSPGIRAAVRRDLASLPVTARAEGLSRQALLLARMLDSGDLEPREIVTAGRELRLTMAELAAKAPGASGGIVDELRARRAARSAAG
jgi:hypothetical protein